MSEAARLREVAPAGAGHGGPGARTALLALALGLVAQALTLGLVAGAWPAPMGLAIEAAFWAPIALLLARAVRGPRALVLAVVMPMLLVAAAHALKLRMLALPVLAADAASVAPLLAVLPVASLLLAASGLALVLLPWAWSLRPRVGGRLALALAFAWPIGLAFSAPWLLPVADDARSPSRLLAEQGPAGFLLADRVRHAGDEARPPSLPEVAAALAGRPPTRGAGPGFRPRNVHLVLLESVWDVRQLEAYAFSEDPFDPRFRAWWEAAGTSHVLSPVFGGATANAEFEALCALPATRAGVSFLSLVQHAAPCLPRVLREAGYHAVALHPWESDYWNRDAVYPRLGFERYRPIDAFALDDVDGMFLNDASTFRQVLAWNGGGDARPRFEYVVSLSSHYPFARDAAKRPALVEVQPRSPVLADAANAIRYTTAAFVDYAEQVLARDPDALLVAFGDHAPVLAGDEDPYVRSGLSRRPPLDELPWTPAMSRTPLLVIDGRAGPRAMGEFPLHQLAPRLLELLGQDAPTLPQGVPPGPLRDRLANSRLFMNTMMVRGDDGAWQVCRDERGRCGEALADRESLRVLRDDLMAGHQYALQVLEADAMAADVAMQREGEFGACGLGVRDWGAMGDGLAPAVDGRRGVPTVWLRLDDGRGQPRLRVGEHEAALMIANGEATAAFPADARLAAPGEHEVSWRCAEGEWQVIGHLRLPAEGAPEVAAPAPPPPPPGPCRMAVEAWGPQRIAAGAGFNVQPDGASALWLRGVEIEGAPTLLLGDEPLAMARAEARASASRAPDASPLPPGSHALHWTCASGESGELGELVVEAPAPPPVPMAAVDAPVVAPAPVCEGGIEAFGPIEVRAGEAFNVLPDGRSALWIRLREGSAPGLALRLGGVDAVAARDGRLMSFAVEGAMAETLARPGRVPLELVCGGRVLDARELVVLDGAPGDG